MLTSSSSEDETKCESHRKEYEELVFQLRAWKPPTLQSTEKSTASIIYQNAFLIYLYCLFHPSSLPSPILTEISLRTEICLPLLVSLYPSAMEVVVLWPAMILGSCLEKENERKMVRDAFGRGRYRMMVVQRGMEMLERVWGSEGVLYGVRGLEVMGSWVTNGCFV